MSQTAARPWWAEVQHLRPADQHEPSDDGQPRTGRFDRPTPPARRPSDDRPTARASSRAAASDAPHEGRAASRPVDAPREARADHGSATAAPATPRRRPRRDPDLWLEPATRPPTQPGQRRTIEIRGQVDRVAGVAPISPAGPQRRRGRRASERVGPRPDRVALWAVLLGLLLILVAAISSPDADAAALVAGWL
ncbi:MAG TPA: hypothetical protein VGW75_17950 [Solirubrobacteraceae bacterium]|jgi:hypothetical protein|nr:hypothetical protein [Solirubrobacteraceae bacterium]